MTNSQRPVYSASQFNMLGKCGVAWKLKYVDRVYENKSKHSLIFGSVVGKCIQELVETKRGAFVTDDEVVEMYTKYLTEELVGKGVPADLAKDTMELVNPKRNYVIDGKIVVEKDYMDFLDSRYKACQLSFSYAGMDKRNKGDKFLCVLPWYVTCIHNGYLTLREKGLLTDIKTVKTEYEVALNATDFDVIGYFDLVIQYNNGNIIVVEIKTSSFKSQNLPSYHDSKQVDTFVNNHLQSRIYHLMSKLVFGDRYKGFYFLNASVQGHCVKGSFTQLDEETTLRLMKVSHLICSQELFLPACGTDTRNAAADSCYVSAQCPHIRGGVCG
jgi:PD-(D/E)XK nuclease superfamily